MESLYVDTSAIVQVIGCIFNNPKILDDDDKYTIIEEDFPEEFHKIIFGSIYNIYSSGSEVSLQAIVDYLANRPKFNVVFTLNKGIEYIQNISKIANFETFNYYYNRLKKFTLLRAYETFGVDVSWFYDPSIVIDLKKKQLQEDRLDNCNLFEIADKIDKRIEEIKTKYVSEDNNDGQQAGKGIDELLESLEENPELGIPMYGSLINTITRGARLKKFYLRSAATGVGKAIPNDTIIPTPEGYKRVGEIKKGDYLFDPSGNFTKVVRVYPQGKKKEIWEITFCDGRKARCCNEHLWEVKIEGKTQVLELKKIYKEFKEGKRITVIKNKPVFYSQKKYQVKPYKQGIEFGREINTPISLAKYLIGSIQQRFETLAGVIDGASEIDENNDLIFYTSCLKNCSSIKELARSLGMYVKDEYIKETEQYVVKIQLTLKERKVLIKNSKIVAKISEEELKNKKEIDEFEIVKIERTRKETDMTCFWVGGKSHLFLMNNFIVTHNTRTMVADAWTFAAKEIYNNQLGMWIKSGAAQPTLFIVTEQDYREFQTMSLAFLSGVNEEHILLNRYEEGEKERILYAKEIIKNSPIWIEHLPDFSIQDVENKIKKHIREHKVSYILFDYLHTSMKILEEVSRRSGGVKLREDNVLFMLSTHLKDIANQYGVFILSATQLNASYQSSDTPDQNLLRGAKSIADRIDVGSVLLSVTNEDIEKIQPILEANNLFEVPTIKISVYKNRGGRYKGIYLWCRSDLGTCRVEPMFVTNWNHKIIQVEDIDIIIKEEEPAPW